jgi:hypothetical protein
VIKTFTKLFAASLPGLLLCACSAQQVDEATLNKTFAPEALRQDLEFLVTILEKRHVNFYERANRDSIEALHRSLDSALTEPMNRAQFFKIIGKLNPYFNDAHCLVFPLTAEADRDVEQGHKLFPFHVVLNESGELYPERSYERAADKVVLDKSDRIDSINGIATVDLLNSIESYSHGETRLLRRHMTTLLFADWLYTLHGWKDDFNLVLASDVVLQITAQDQWKSLERNVVQYNRFEMMDDVGYLRLASFDVDEHEDAYEDFIDQTFEKIVTAGTQKLIIDVRGNTGGQSDAGALVLQYLVDKPVNQVSKAVERIHEGNKGLLSYRGNVGELKQMDMTHDELIKPVSPDKRYNGKVVVLIDEMVYSAGILFITTVQDHKIGILAGRPTGGYANQTGNIEAFYLPNTQLMVYAPARNFVRPNGDGSTHIVTPDTLLLVPDSLLSTGDFILEKALGLMDR